MPGNRAGIIPRVDVRGDRGYVIAPPSQRSDGKSYSWLTSLLVQAPAIAPVALLNLIRRPKRRDFSPRIHRIPPRGTGGGGTPYGLAALESEIATLSRAPAGTRNDSLFHAAICLGQLVASKELELSVVEAALTKAAKAWPSFNKSLSTIRSGLSRGLTEPREPRWASTRKVRPGAHTTAPDDLNSKLAELDMTDLGNARRFQARYSGRFLHSELTGWCQYDGRRWTTEGADAAVLRAAQETVDALKSEADALENEANDDGE